MVGSVNSPESRRPDSRSIGRGASVLGFVVGAVLVAGLVGAYKALVPNLPTPVAAAPAPASSSAGAASSDFVIYGEVRRPGRYPALPTDTAAGLVLRAGGLTSDARERVKVIRKVPGKGNVTILVNLRDVLSKGMPQKDVPLIPGDTLVVEERLIKL